MTNLNQLSGSSTFSGSVSLTQPIDYTFTLSQKSAFTAILNGLSGDANLQLRSSAMSTIVAQSENPGTATDALNQVLDAGIYTLSIKTSSSSSISYSLALQGGPQTSSSLASNLFWRNTSTDQISLWQMDGTNLNAGTLLGNAPDRLNWKLVGTADLNGDGQSDFVWRNQTTDQTEVWTIKNGAYVSSAFLGNSPSIGANSPWRIVGVADFTGDGQSDFLWRNQQTDQTAIWTIKNGAFVSGAFLGNSPSIGANSPWTIVGVADFTGDGQSDFLWRNQQTDQTFIWSIKNGAYVSGALLGNSPSVGANSPWTIVSTADFTGDGQPDFLWRNQQTDQTFIWTIKNGAYVSGALLGNSLTIGANPAWQVVGVEDFTGDGESDLLWRNQQTDQTQIWTLKNGAYVSSALLGNAPAIGANSSWTIVGTADFTGDGQADLLWRNQQTDQTVIWTLKNGAFVSGALLGNSPSIGANSLWRIVGVADFTGDGQADFLWRNQQTDQTFIWSIKNRAYVSGALLGNAPSIGANSTWTIVGASDFNGDRQPDILWRNQTTGQGVVWFVKDGKYTSGVLVGNAPAVRGSDWQIVGIGKQKGGTNQATSLSLTIGGETLQSALSLGTFGTLSKYTDALKAGKTAFYQFTLSKTQDILASIDLGGRGTTLQLLDSTGQEVITPIATLGAGTYTIKVTTTQDDRYTFRINTADVPVTGMRRLGSPNNNDLPASTALDSQGNVYVVGATGGDLTKINSINSGSSSGGFLAKYDKFGTFKWVREIAVNGTTVVNGIAIDSQDNLFLTGRAAGTVATSVLRTDAFALKYDSNGVQKWVRQFGGVDNEVGTAITVDRNGKVYIAGTTGGTLAGTSAGQTDGFITQFDTNGNQQWLKQFGTSSNDFTTSVAVDSSSNVYIGSTDVGGNHNLIQYDQFGNQKWNKLLKTSLGTIGKIAVDSSDRINVVTWSSLIQLDSTGTVKFNRPIADFSGQSVAIGPNNAIYVTGDYLFSKSYLAQYDSNGQRTSIKSIGRDEDLEVPVDIVVNSQGQAYISGTINTGSLSDGYRDTFIYGETFV